MKTITEDCDSETASAEWDDTKLRHAYKPDNRQCALCGYDGPSTWKNEWVVPCNVCPICLALLSECYDLVNQRWLRK